MLCKKPFMKGDMPFGCGQCLPCRIKTRRLWTHRIVLESCCHSGNSFLTLTYDDEHLPPNASLRPRDAQIYIKRLRNAVRPLKVRYYLVGEYGDESQRPHYHLGVFGLGPEYESVFQNAWGLGHVYTGELNQKSAQYIAGYVTKKMTKKDDPRLLGRYPEFARMSLRPGIGALCVPEIEKILTSTVGIDQLIFEGDVPAYLMMGTKKFPLGRYIMRKIRERMGFHDLSVPKDKLQQVKSEMRALYQKHLGEEALSKNPIVAESQRKIILEKENSQKILQLETKQKIFSKKGTI